MSESNGTRSGVVAKSYAAHITASEPDTTESIGEFDALVSAFGNTDSYGDIVQRGAFRDTLEEWVQKGKPVPVVWSHDLSSPDSILGRFTSLEETPEGLKAHGVLDLGHPQAARVHQLMRDGLISEFSWSGVIRDAEPLEAGALRIKSVDLWEAGPCFKGANPATELLGVKNGYPTESQNNTMPKLGKPNKDGGQDMATETQPRKSAEELLEDVTAAAEELASRAAAGEDMSDEDVAKAKHLQSERVRLEKQVQTNAAFKALTSLPNPSNEEEEPWAVRRTSGVVGGKSGSRVDVKAKRFTDNVMAAFKAAAPSVGGPYARKDLIPSGSIAVQFDGTIVEDPKQKFSLAAVLGSASVDAPAGQYLRQTVRENNAATVPGGARKPISTYEMKPVPWSISTVAHLSSPIRTQWLSDYEGMSDFIIQEMAYGVDAAVNQFILTGGVNEENEPVEGLLTIDGVTVTEAAPTPERTVRRAIRELEVEGVESTHIIMSPKDWEDIEVGTDANGRPLYADAPIDRVNQRLWGLQVVTPAQMATGVCIVGDLSGITLLNRESHTVTWGRDVADVGTGDTPEFRDLLRHNEVRFRDELRVGLAIRTLKSWRRMNLTPQSGGEG